jgi:hypothetical protein
MRKHATPAAFAVSFVALLFASQTQGADSSNNSSKDNSPQAGGSRIQREVRHELVTLSRYSVFDNIAYRVDGTQVTLVGQVVLPVLKGDAGKAR